MENNLPSGVGKLIDSDSQDRLGVFHWCNVRYVQMSAVLITLHLLAVHHGPDLSHLSSVI